MKFRERITTDFLYVLHEDIKEMPVKELSKVARREGKLHVDYHFYIHRDGTVEQGRDETVIAGYGLENSERSIYVLVDSGDVMQITDSQKLSLFLLTESLTCTYPDMNIIGN